MKYVDEFRDPEKAKILISEINDIAERVSVGRTRPIRIMEVCGGHTHSIFRYGIENILPETIELMSHFALVHRLFISETCIHEKSS